MSEQGSKVVANIIAIAALTALAILMTRVGCTVRVECQDGSEVAKPTRAP